MQTSLCYTGTANLQIPLELMKTLQLVLYVNSCISWVCFATTKRCGCMSCQTFGGNIFKQLHFKSAEFYSHFTFRPENENALVMWRSSHCTASIGVFVNFRELQKHSGAFSLCFLMHWLKITLIFYNEIALKNIYEGDHIDNHFEIFSFVVLGHFNHTEKF